VNDLHVPARRLRRPSWRDSRLLIGVLIVLVSITIGSRVVAAADETVPIFAAGATLASGHPVTLADLRVVRVRLGGGTAGYLSARTPPPAGLVLIRPLGAGELVPMSALAPAASLSRRPVSVPVPAPLPDTLAPGVTVDLWSSAKDTAVGSTGFRQPVRIAQAAEIYSVSNPSGGLSAAQGSSVQVLLEEADLRALLDALANGAKVAVVPALGGPAAAGSPPSGPAPAGAGG